MRNRTVFAMLFFVVTCVAQVLAAADRPNLVFIIADDLTFRDIGCYGGQAHTPHIDRLATEGMQIRAVLSSGAHVLAHATQHLHRAVSGEDRCLSESHVCQRWHSEHCPLPATAWLSCRPVGQERTSLRETVFPFRVLGSDNNPDMDGDRSFDGRVRRPGHTVLSVRLLQRTALAVGQR